jgi:hypothetical protein
MQLLQVSLNHKCIQECTQNEGVPLIMLTELPVVLIHPVIWSKVAHRVVPRPYAPQRQSYNAFQVC